MTVKTKNAVLAYLMQQEEINRFKSDISDLKTDLEDKISDKVGSDEVYLIDEMDLKLSDKVNNADVYKKSDVDLKLGDKANITDVYTSDVVDSKLGDKANSLDVYTKIQIDTELNLKANSSDVYVKGDIDTRLSDKANLTDTYSKLEVDSAITFGVDSRLSADEKLHLENGETLSGDKVYHVSFKPSKADIGLSNVENKSSEDIRGDITKSDILATNLNASDVKARADSWTPAVNDLPGGIPISKVSNLQTTLNSKQSYISLAQSAPSNKINGTLWIDTSQTVNVLKRYNGSSWVKVTPTTASEVSARSSSWVPTAAQVGARPDSWMPNALDVGARSNSWLPSASDIGLGNVENKSVSDIQNEFQKYIGTQLIVNDWELGSGATGFFNLNGSSSENHRVLGTNPNGERALLWECRPDSSSNADGGWVTDSFSVNNAKTYRFSVFVKTSSNSGTTYLGCKANTVCNINSATKDTNPYFWSGDLPSNNKWYLIVGYIFPAGQTGLSTQGGIYDCTTSKKVANVSRSFNWASDAVNGFHRCYHYYDTNTSTRQWMYHPRVDLVDGNEPSILNLLGKVTPESIGAVTSSEASTIADGRIASKVGSDTVIGYLKAGKKSTGAFPTATEVGARSSSWMPTAAQVGARSDSWIPTAAQVGAITSSEASSIADGRIATKVGSDTIIGYLKAGKKSNGSFPTATEIGARSSSWMPTAAEVGARSSSWTPGVNDLPTIPQTKVQGLTTDLSGLNTRVTNVEDDVNDLQQASQQPGGLRP